MTHTRKLNSDEKQKVVNLLDEVLVNENERFNDYEISVVEKILLTYEPVKFDCKKCKTLIDIFKYNISMHIVLDPKESIAYPFVKEISCFEFEELTKEDF